LAHFYLIVSGYCQIEEVVKGAGALLVSFAFVASQYGDVSIVVVDAAYTLSRVSVEFTRTRILESRIV
jgi:hypothetical protein